MLQKGKQIVGSQCNVHMLIIIMTLCMFMFTYFKTFHDFSDGRCATSIFLLHWIGWCTHLQQSHKSRLVHGNECLGDHQINKYKLDTCIYLSYYNVSDCIKSNLVSHFPIYCSRLLVRLCIKDYALKVPRQVLKGHRLSEGMWLGFIQVCYVQLSIITYVQMYNIYNNIPQVI